MREARTHKLADVDCRNAKGKAKLYKLGDGGGLALWVTPDGGRRWRMSYERTGKANTLSLGIYPDVSLKLARERAAAMREQLAQGIDPSVARQTEKAIASGSAARTFGKVADDWYAAESSQWRSDRYRTGIRRILDKDVLPLIGHRPVSAILPREVREVFQKIKASGREETGRRTRIMVGQIFRSAVGNGLIDADPTQSLPREKRVKAKRHFAALTDPADVARLMQAIEGYRGTPEVRAALTLSALLFQRPGEIRRMEWPQLDLEAGLWRYTVSKTMTPHVVPLASQAVTVLKALQPLTGKPLQTRPDAPHYVLAGARSRYRPLSENAVRVALRTLGFGNDEMTPHGFRAMARTLLAEQGWPTDAIERQLAHKAAGPLGAAYDRAQFLTERRKMMQSWADYLDGLAAGTGKVVMLRRVAA